jgi:hypothetical protein
MQCSTTFSTVSSTVSCSKHMWAAHEEGHQSRTIDTSNTVHKNFGYFIPLSRILYKSMAVIPMVTYHIVVPFLIVDEQFRRLQSFLALFSLRMMWCHLPIELLHYFASSPLFI